MNLPKLPKTFKQTPMTFMSHVFWGTRNPELVYQHVQAIIPEVSSGAFFGDNLMTWGRNMSMLEDEVFINSWRNNMESESDQAIIWRRYILACCAYHCVHLEGDFVECGAYRGVGVKTVMDYLGGPEFPKTFWAYDLFEHTEGMTHPKMTGHVEGLYEQVMTKFAGYDNIRIVKGMIPDSFEGNSPEKIAYMHIDLNQVEAEMAALKALFPRMVPGGMLILDDYEWSSVYRVQKLAEDPWFEEQGYRVMPLPTGQGLVFKR